MNEDEVTTATRIVGALVVLTSIEGFDELKKAADRIGCRILFQKVAPPYQKLWIVERGRDEG